MFYSLSLPSFPQRQICLSSFLKHPELLKIVQCLNELYLSIMNCIFSSREQSHLKISASVSGTFPHAFCSSLWLTLPDLLTAIMFWRSEYIYATILLKFLLTLNVWCLKGGNTTIWK